MGLFSVYGNVRRMVLHSIEGKEFCNSIWIEMEARLVRLSRETCNVLEPTKGPIVVNTCCESIVRSSRAP